MRILGRGLIIIPFIKLLVDFVPTLEDFNIYYTDNSPLRINGIDFVYSESDV